jgi:hypothetical protein
MVVEFNPIVARLGTAVVAAKEERTMMEGHWELQTEVHFGYHDPGCHESENDCWGGGCHAERCLQKVAAEWCAWQHENRCLPF